MPPYLDPRINLGDLVTLLTLGVGFLITIGKFAQEIKNQAKELAQIRIDQNKALEQVRSDFLAHALQDQQSFNAIHQAVLEIALNTKGDNNG